MRVLCAPGSFKESLSAGDAAAAMAEGAGRREGVEAACCPVADGGDGSLDVLARALGAAVHARTVTGPLGEPCEGRYAVAPDGTGIVALADASGLALVPPWRREPLRTTTYGTGELIDACARAGCERVIVCLGGSATVDGGAGIAQALGAAFRDASGAPLTAPLTGGTIGRVASAEPPADLPRIVACCDVDNPLLGRRGAAAVYGPQKGASAEQVDVLEQALASLAHVLGGDPRAPGAGSAGGAGWGLATLCGARLARGAELILDLIGFDARLEDCNLVLTGEGALDSQTRAGKAPLEVARRAAKRGTPVIAIVGRAEPGTGPPFTQVVSLVDRYGEDRAMTEAYKCLAEAAQEACVGW